MAVTPVLTDGDRQSVAWKKVEKYLNERLEKLRKMNDDDLDPEKTAKIRGRIREAKALLALGNPAPTVTDD